MLQRRRRSLNGPQNNYRYQDDYKMRFSQSFSDLRKAAKLLLECLSHILTVIKDSRYMFLETGFFNVPPLMRYPRTDGGPERCRWTAPRSREGALTSFLIRSHAYKTRCQSCPCNRRNAFGWKNCTSSVKYPILKSRPQNCTRLPRMALVHEAQFYGEGCMEKRPTGIDGRMWRPRQGSLHVSGLLTS